MKILKLTLVCAIVSGCAEAPNKIAANYVSPVQYSNLDCSQIHAEMLSVAGHVRVLVGQQQKKHKNDQVAMGVGLIVAWPALFFLIGGDKKEELAEMKGEYEALEAVAIQKKCDVASEVTTSQPQADVPAAVAAPH